MTEKEKNEYKRNREFYSLEINGKRHKKNLIKNKWLTFNTLFNP